MDKPAWFKEHEIDDARHFQALQDDINEIKAMLKEQNEALQPLLDAVNAGKLSYRFALGLIAFLASLGGLILLLRQLK